jgi:L-alanine-DL-glutamate epimerase-like enolase superfamily enzyme
VEIVDGEHTGRGEGLGVSYHGETVTSMLDQLSAVAGALAGGISRADLQSVLPAGGARNAVDCALWDLEAKRTGRRAWTLAGIPSASALITDLTLGLGTAESMSRVAHAARNYSRLKLKLSGAGDLDRVAAVRAVRQDAEIIVDANQAWSERQLYELTPKLADLGVALLEQPLPLGRDDVLAKFDSPIPLCADESCQTRLSLDSVIGKYQYINIKLDKSGGLTEALALAREAHARKLKLMVGCMAGSSLSMAPAFIVGQLCKFIDLDGPLLLASDVRHPILYQDDRMHPPDQALWG